MQTALRTPVHKSGTPTTSVSASRQHSQLRYTVPVHPQKVFLYAESTQNSGTQFRYTSRQCFCIQTALRTPVHSSGIPTDSVTVCRQHSELRYTVPVNPQSVFLHSDSTQNSGTQFRYTHRQCFCMQTALRTPVHSSGTPTVCVLCIQTAFRTPVHSSGIPTDSVSLCRQHSELRYTVPVHPQSLFLHPDSTQNSGTQFRYTYRHCFCMQKALITPAHSSGTPTDSVSAFRQHSELRYTVPVYPQTVFLNADSTQNSGTEFR
jgi:hypothetical protein